MPKGETEATVEEIDEPVVESDGAVKLEEKVIYEEISEEEAGITRRQFLTKALRISFGAFAGIQAISWLGFFWPKVSGGFGSKVDAGPIEEIKVKYSKLMDLSFQLLFQQQELMCFHWMQLRLPTLSLRLAQQLLMV